MLLLPEPGEKELLVLLRRLVQIVELLLLPEPGEKELLVLLRRLVQIAEFVQGSCWFQGGPILIL